MRTREQLKQYQLTDISKREFCRCFRHSRRESKLDKEDEVSVISSNIIFHLFAPSANGRCRLAMKTSDAKHTNIKHAVYPSRSPCCMFTTALRTRNIGTVTSGRRLRAEDQDMIQEHYSYSSYELNGSIDQCRKEFISREFLESFQGAVFSSISHRTD
jgi:hypothetical protein